MSDLESESGLRDQKPTPRDISRVADRHEGVITLAQLYALGFSYEQIRHLVASGSLHPLHRGVFLVGHRRASSDAHLIAAQLAAGPDSFLSNRTGAAILKLRPLNLRQIEITVPRGKGRSRDNLIIHRTRTAPDRDEIRTTPKGVRHSSFARLLIELAPRETPQELTRLVEEGVRRNLFYIEKIERALERHARRPGIANLEAPLAYYLDRTDRTSPLERDFDRELAKRPEIPPPTDTNTYIKAGGITWEIDCYWKEHGVVVELDGRPWHIVQRDLEKDKRKDMKLAAIGLVPVRVTSKRFDSDQDGVFDDLRALLRLRRAA